MEEKKKPAKERAILPTFSIYHGNPENTGTAMTVRMQPATLRQGGFVQFEIANQATAGVQTEEGRVYPTFDWDKRVAFRLNPVEVAEMVRCLRGMTESVRDGAGYIHKGQKGSAKILFAHAVEPRPHFNLKAYTLKADGAERTIGIDVYPAEAMALEMALSGSFGRLCFG